jgi:hypothetical protein
MTQQVNADTVALQLEKVRERLPLLYEREGTFFSMLQQRGDVEQVSSRNMRVPLQIRPGGKAGQVSFDGGDLGRGAGTLYEVAQLAPLDFKFGIELTKRIEYSTNTAEKAIANAVTRETANGMAQFRNFLDRYLQTKGDCILGTVLTEADPILTMATPELANLVYEGQTIQIYDTTMATNRGTWEVLSIDYPNAQITFTGTMPVGTVATDEVVVDGVTGADPVGLFGVPYHHDEAATGTWLNLNRATYPQIRTPRVNASSAALTTGPIRLALNKIRKALGGDILQSTRLEACMNVEQEDAYEALAITISEIIKEGSDQQGVDLFFNGRKTMSGIPIYANVHWNPERIDFTALAHWGRAVSKDIDLYEVDGNTVFPLYAAGGGLLAAMIFYIVTSFQVWTDNPRAGAYIDTLAKPTGY